VSSELIKILLVDDREDNLVSMELVLEKDGYSFSKATSGRDALKILLKEEDFSLILMDVKMPIMDGYETAEIIYRREKLRHIPIIFITGQDYEEAEVFKGYQTGAVDYIRKPFNPLILRSKVAVFAELYKKNRLLIKQEKKLKIVNQDLLQLNQELEERVASRTKALAESENRFHSMIETIPQIAWTNTVEGEVTFYNQRWYDYTGLDHEQTQGEGWQTVIHPDDLQYTLDQKKLIQETSDGGEFQNRKKRADGVYRWYLIRLRPIKNKEGELPLWVGTATDIHELRLLQQQKDDFMSIASHELKTPVTTLKASLQLLERMKDNPKMLATLIGQANKSMGRVTTLIENLMNTNKLNEGQLHLHKTSFTIAQMIADCCQYVRIAGQYTIITDGDKKLMVSADADRIDQVVINFVNNAIKYAPGTKEIHANIEKINNMAKVSISDKGPGIHPEKLPYLFDRYYRVDSSGMQYSGLGLGLYISSEIIKRHGGQIGVDSEIGKGSTFWFTLPLS
jgi:two-component system CheB/CheR fusion protein